MIFPLKYSICWSPHRFEQKMIHSAVFTTVFFSALVWLTLRSLLYLPIDKGIERNTHTMIHGSKKGDFFRIGHLQISFPSYYRQLVSENIFWPFLTKSKRDQALLKVMGVGKYGPIAPNLDYGFWAQFTASQKTIFRPKITSKNECSGAKLLGSRYLGPWGVIILDTGWRCSRALK